MLISYNKQLKPTFSYSSLNSNYTPLIDTYLFDMLFTVQAVQGESPHCFPRHLFVLVLAVVFVVLAGCGVVWCCHRRLECF